MRQRLAYTIDGKVVRDNDYRAWRLLDIEEQEKLYESGFHAPPPLKQPTVEPVIDSLTGVAILAPVLLTSDQQQQSPAPEGDAPGEQSEAKKPKAKKPTSSTQNKARKPAEDKGA